MIPYLSTRESSPILAMTKPPAEKWTPTPGQTIEVAMSLSGMRYQREFLRMEGDIYVTNSQSVLGKEWRWRCAWPIKRASYTPPNVSAAQAEPIAQSVQRAPAIATPAAADPDGWIGWEEGDDPPSGMLEVKWVHWELGEITGVLDARKVFWGEDSSVIAYKVLP